MKNTKKMMAALLSLAMVSAIAPMSVFAETVTQDDELPKSVDSFKVTYTYSPALPQYTVTIPTGVTLSDDETTSESITATGVENLDDKKIKVVLTKGTYTTEGGTFHAKNGDSVVTYPIGKDDEVTGVSVGDTIAEFTGNDSQKLSFSKADTTNATVAGEHSENLTFTISVEDAAYVPKTFTSLSDGDVLRVGDTLEVASGEYIFLDDGCSLMAWNAPFTVLRANVEGINGPTMMPTVTEDANGTYYVIKGNENNYFDFSGKLVATDTSDGVKITKNGDYWAIAVNEP